MFFLFELVFIRLSEQRRKEALEREKREGRKCVIDTITLRVDKVDGDIIEITEEQDIKFLENHVFRPKIHIDVYGKITKKIGNTPRIEAEITTKHNEKINLITNENIDRDCEESLNLLECRPRSGREFLEGEQVKLTIKRRYLRRDLETNSGLKFLLQIRKPTNTTIIQIPKKIKETHKIKTWIVDHEGDEIRLESKEIENNGNYIIIMRPRNRRRFYILDTINMIILPAHGGGKR